MGKKKKRKIESMKSGGDEHVPEESAMRLETVIDRNNRWVERIGKWVTNVLSLGNGVFELVNRCIAFAAACCAYLSKNLWICGIAIFIVSANLAWFLIKRKRMKIFVATVIAVSFFGIGTISCLAAFGRIQITLNLDGEVAPVSTGNDGGEDGNDSQKELEQVDSTESPKPTYVAMTFESKITSVVWKALIEDVKDVGVTGTKDNFEMLRQRVFATMGSEAENMEQGNMEKHHTKAIRENVDQIEKLEREADGWSRRMEISRLRMENYSFYASTDNAHQSGMAALDCLDWMGKVNGKEGKEVNKAIYNEENLIRYGDQAIDGLFGWWSAIHAAGNVQGGNESCFYFGQTFHHLGGCDEMTGDVTSVEYLALSAVFYAEELTNDEIFYKDGQANEKQYYACKYYAIVCDKLDNKLRPEDSFFLLEAERYYRYYLYNANLSTAEEKRIEDYIEIVKEKKRRRGL